MTVDGARPVMPGDTTKLQDTFSKSSRGQKGEENLAGFGTSMFQQNKEGKKKETPIDPNTMAAFAEKLAAAQNPGAGAKSSKGDGRPDENDLSDVMDSITLAGQAAAAPQGQAVPAAQLSPPQGQQAEAVVQKIVETVQASERMALTLHKGSEVTVPITAPLLGMNSVKLTMTGGELVVTLTAARAADPAVIAAAVQELTSQLSQRFPAKVIRVAEAKEMAESEGQKPEEFDPFRQPVTRRDNSSSL